MTRTVFIDIDGTLLTHDHTIPSSATAALQKAAENGTRLVFCTGRNAPEVFPELWEHGFSGLVGGGGAYGEIDGRVIFDHRINQELIAEASTWMDDHDLPWVWQTPTFLSGTQSFWDSFSAPSQSEEARRGRQRFIDQILPYLREGRPDTASKAVIILPTGSPVTFAEFHKRFRDDFTVVAGSMSDTFGQSVELMPAGVNKATGMFELASHLGVPRDGIVAIGDSDNDIEMIEQAPLGIAMGNSVPGVLRVADWITTDVSQDGLANALRYAGIVR